MNTSAEIIRKKLQYLESKILISRSSDVYKWIIAATEGRTEIKPCTIVGYGKNTRYIDRSEQLFFWLNFLKLEYEILNNSSRGGKLHTIVRVSI